MKFRSAVFALLLTLPSFACDEESPTAPSGGVNVTVTQTVNLGQSLPNGPAASPTPIPPGAVDKTITRITVTEIGGDGARTFPVDATAAITATPRNASGEDPCVGFPSLTACGAYTEQDIRWFAGTGVGGTGASCTDTSVVVLDLGSSDTNYNRRFRTCRPGTFTYSAQFRNLEPVSFTGTVLAAGATAEGLSIFDFGWVR